MMPLQITNQRDKACQITYYGVDVLVSDKWVRLAPLPTTREADIYYIGAGITNAQHTSFTPGHLEDVIKGKNLDVGIPVSGWTFFQFPRELRSTNVPGITSIRIILVDSFGEQQVTTINPNDLGPPSMIESYFYTTVTNIPPRNLQNEPIFPMMDVTTRVF